MKRNPFLTIALVLLVMMGCSKPQYHRPESPTLITFSNVDKAWALSKGQGVTVAVLDWQFDLSGKAAGKYVSPTSLVPGEEIGKLKPWHGEWMGQIIHTVAPEAKIIPINARGLKDRDHEKYIPKGIHYAVDHGAIAVCSSMGTLKLCPELSEAIDYAEQHGTVFIDVHPEYKTGEKGEAVPADSAELDPRIIHAGIVSVPDHLVNPESHREVYTWPYDLEAKYKDGWGYSNGPPVICGVVALMKSACPNMTPQQIRETLIQTASDRDGFRVLDAEAAVKSVKSRL